MADEDLTPEDRTAASEALLAWLKSQGLKPRAAVPVLINCIALAITSVAKDRAAALDGAKRVSRAIEAVVRGMPEEP